MLKFTTLHADASLTGRKKVKKLVGVGACSAERANLLDLLREQTEEYLSIKRFNQESKEQTLRNFYTELKYTLNLIVGFRDIVDFIYQLLKLRTIVEIDKDIRLHLHRYFECELTVTLHVSNPHWLEEGTRIQGQTSHSQAFTLSFGQLGPLLQGAVRDRRSVQVAHCSGENTIELKQTMLSLLNISLENFSAYPIVIDGTCHYLILICNRKAT